MTDADIVIWFAMRFPGRTSSRRIEAVFGDVHYRLDHLVQLGLLRRHMNLQTCEAEYSLVLHARYQGRKAA